MAAITPRYSFPYQEATDPPAGHSLGENLAEAVEDALGDVDDDLTALTTRVTTVEPKAATLFDQRTADAAGISSTTLVSVLQVTLPKTGTYVFDALVTLTNVTAVGRPGFALGGTATATAWRWSSGTVHYNSATASQATNTSGTTYPAATAGTAIVNSDFTTTTGHSYVHIKGTVTVSATGTLQFRFSEASGSGTVSVKAGSMVTVSYIS